VTLELGCDISNFSAVPTREQLQCWWDGGIRMVIVGCQRDSAAHAQLQALTADGRFALEAYQYYFWDGSEVERTNRALKVMADFGLKRLWIDVEEARGQATQEQVTQAIRNAVITVTNAGLGAGIYTGGWCFPELTGNTTEFSGLPLWTAAYPANKQPPDFNTFHSYGGWTRPLIWQYAGSTDLCGINVDLNARELAVAAVAFGVVTSAKDGWLKEGNFQVLYNSGAAVLRVGSTDGQSPGRISKNFGGQWVYLRNDGQGRVFWSTEEGD